MKRIDSRENRTYRQLTGLRQSRESRSQGLVFLEGLRLCADAMQSGAQAAYALIADRASELPAVCSILADLPETTELLQLPDRLFDKLCETQQPQGIALVCRSPLLEQPDRPPEPDGLYLIAEEIQDPGNLGTMIRTADAFGFNGVLVTTGTVYPFSDKVMRAAMGSCFHVPIMAMPDIRDVAEWLRSGERPIPLLAADPQGEESLSAQWPVPAALAIGNEARGLSAEIRDRCDILVRIPMPGRAESLNAAAAAAVLCYELMRTRLNLRKK